MNVSNDELYIGYNDDRTQVTNIEGKYSDIKIENADDALDAINGVRSILGLNNPYEELESSVSTSDNYGGEYSFSQIYNGVRVYGRSVMASANASGEADFLSSSLLASDVLDRANMRATLTSEQAEDAALNACIAEDSEGDFAADSDSTEQVVYSIGSYDARPVYAYIVRVFGNTSEGNYVDGNIFINASNGEVIDSFSNIRGIDVEGYNELRERVSFPVFPENNLLILFDNVLNISMFKEGDRLKAIKENRDIVDCISLDTVISHDSYDGHVISAYTNMREIMQWWKSDFNRNSLDNEEMPVFVFTHAVDLDSGLDNAAWCGSYIKVGNISMLRVALGWKHTLAAAIDILAHETGHAVLDYSGGADLPYKNAPGAIDEGYADIFGCLKDKNWTIGEHIFEANSERCLRNVANPGDSKADTKGPDKVNGPRYVDFTKWYNNIDFHLWFINISSDEFSDNGGVHKNSLIISHAAYLMYEDATPGGLNWQTLEQVWYRSMRLGNYGATTEFKDVRTAVVRAARKLNISAEQLAIIKDAFDQVGIEGASGTISGTITDHNSHYPVQGAVVNAMLNSVIPINAGRQTTGADGKYSFNLEYSRSKYIINITAQNYVEFFAIQTIEESEDKKMDVALVRSGSGSGSIIVRSAVDDSIIDGVTLNFRRGWNMHPENASTVRSGDVTGANGTFTYNNIASGYYTVEMIKDGYAVSYFNITIAPGENSMQTGYLSPTMSDSEYRVVLSWGANPRDLDSHLAGRHPNGSSAHVYFGSQSGSVNGKSIYLDIDDTTSYGPETITFEADTESSYEYYIVWYAGYGTWKNSEAVINVYNGNRHVAVYPVPEVDNSSGVWSVFRIRRGILTPINEIVLTYPEP